jgi:hypothetical protein
MQEIRVIVTSAELAPRSTAYLLYFVAIMAAIMNVLSPNSDKILADIE